MSASQPEQEHAKKMAILRLRSLAKALEQYADEMECGNMTLVKDTTDLHEIATIDCGGHDWDRPLAGSRIKCMSIMLSGEQEWRLNE